MKEGTKAQRQTGGAAAKYAGLSTERRRRANARWRARRAARLRTGYRRGCWRAGSIRRRYLTLLPPAQADITRSGGKGKEEGEGRGQHHTGTHTGTEKHWGSHARQTSSSYLVPRLSRLPFVAHSPLAAVLPYLSSRACGGIRRDNSV